MTLHPELTLLDNGTETFFKRKAPGAYRIFCVGGSITRGWPFHRVGGSYPRFLSAYLKDLLPHREIEVINAGFMGSDSFSDLGLVRQLLEYEPDLLLIYEGQADIWNWRLHVGWRAKVLRAHFWALRRIRLYEALSRRFGAGEEGFNHAGAIRKWAKVSERAGGREQLRRVRDILRNLKAMRDLAARKNCKMVLITQVDAPEEVRVRLVNLWLRTFARREGIPLIDADRAFQKAPRPLEELLVPPAHPDLPGYALMAETAARVLAENDIIAPASEWKWARLRSETEYRARLGVTDRSLAEVYRHVGDLLLSLGQSTDAQRYLERSRGKAESDDRP